MQVAFRSGLTVFTAELQFIRSDTPPDPHSSKFGFE